MVTGVVGLGNMGRAIAERLAETGDALVLWNRTPGKTGGIAGAEVAGSPHAVARAAPVTLSVLADDRAIEAVYFGPGGFCSAPLEGALIVEMCTTSPATTERLAAAVRAAGGRFVECPVGGTVAPARAGKLLCLMGGEAADVAAARPVLERIARRIEHLGPVGAGAAMKLSINLPLMVYWAALGEAVGLARARGVDVTQALDILADSSGAIGAAKTRVPPIREMLVNGDPGGVNLTLVNGIKDMALMADLAAEAGRDAPVIAAAKASAERAAAGGWADLDVSLYGIYDERTK